MRFKCEMSSSVVVEDAGQKWVGDVAQMPCQGTQALAAPPSLARLGNGNTRIAVPVSIGIHAMRPGTRAAEF